MPAQKGGIINLLKKNIFAFLFLWKTIYDERNENSILEKTQTERKLDSKFVKIHWKGIRGIVSKLFGIKIGNNKMNEICSFWKGILFYQFIVLIIIYFTIQINQMEYLVFELDK